MNLVKITNKKPISISLAICLTAGIATGAGLANPGPATFAATQHQGHHGAAPTNQIPGTAAAPPVGPTAPVGSINAIDISEFAFGGNLQVRPGELVTVNNFDSAPHSLTADDGSFDTGIFDGGRSATFSAPATPGAYSFSCLVHPFMQATLVVQA